MGATEPRRFAMHIRLEVIGVFAVAGKQFDPAVVGGVHELFVECAVGPEILAAAASAFASERRGGTKWMRDTWHVPLLRVTLPVSPGHDGFEAYWEAADSLFRSLHAVTL